MAVYFGETNPADWAVSTSVFRAYQVCPSPHRLISSCTGLMTNDSENVQLLVPRLTINHDGDFSLYFSKRATDLVEAIKSMP